MGSENGKKTDRSSWVNETYRAGRDVDSFVDDAIRTGDYSALNEKINRALNQAADSIHDALAGEEGAGSRQGGNSRGEKRAEAQQTGSSYRTGTYRQTYGRDTAYEQAWRRASIGSEEEYSYPAGHGHVAVKGSDGAGAEKAVGTGGLVLNALLGLLVLLGSGSGGIGGAVFFFVIAYLFYLLRKRGVTKKERTQKARRVMRIAGDRDVVSVEEIASAFNLPLSGARTMLEDLIRSGVLSGTVYLDKKGTTLMLSADAYEQYREVMADYRRRKKEEKAAAGKDAASKQKRQDGKRTGDPERGSRTEEGRQSAAGDSGRGEGTGSSGSGLEDFSGKRLKEYRKMQQQSADRETHNAKLSAETKKILEEGHAFIDHIHQKNDEIPSEEISAKLDRLERIVTSIFDQVERNPESAPDLHRLMSYYLPTTQKLVDTYASLDAQHVSGTNIDTAKREIEDSLDTINEAYERLLDSFFQSTAWDVGTDVSVMKSMLQQDGLTEDELQRIQRKSEKKKKEEGTDTEPERTGEPGAGESGTKSAGMKRDGAPKTVSDSTGGMAFARQEEKE